MTWLCDVVVVMQGCYDDLVNLVSIEVVSTKSTILWMRWLSIQDGWMNELMLGWNEGLIDEVFI